MRNLETERLTLRRLSTDDAEDFYEYAKDPEVGPPAGWKPHESLEETKNIIQNMFDVCYTWAIRLKDSDKVIGVIALEPDKHRPEAESLEIGYSLSREYWGRGIMTEAAEAVIEYGFEEMDLELIAISTSKVNKRSQGVIKKCGFTYEGTVRKTYKIYTGELRDSMIFSILREEYEARK
mgnify:CR=1 FL=1